MKNWRREARNRAGLITTQQVVRSVWLGAIIGVVAGAGAIAFAWSIDFATEHLLGAITGYHPPQPLGEGSIESSGPSRAWLLPLVLAGGGLAAGLIVWLFAPEAEGHGTDAAIQAFHRQGGRVRLRVAPVKLVASAITIGSGGAAGREGPTAQMGGSFGSFIADRMKLGAVERRRALAAGMAGGIGAIFRAPLGGAMMAAEVFYKHDFESEVILLSLISSIVGFSVYGAWAGWDPIFGGGATFSFSHPVELIYYAILGVLCGGIGLLYARGFYGAIRAFQAMRLPRWLTPAIGGALAGCIGIAMPESIHVGYGTVQKLMIEDDLRSFSPYLLLLLPFARIATTSLTVGSGGSGGIFGPGMVIGGVTGAAAWKLGSDLPGFPEQPGPVVIVCMIAVFGSIAHAPIAMLIMVGEMTGNLSLLAPAMVAVAVATLVVGETSIYESQVPTRADSPAHRHRFAFPLLEALPAGRAMRPAIHIRADTRVAAAIEVLEASGARHGVVEDASGRPLGEVSLESLRSSDGDALAGEAADSIVATVSSETPLDEALDQLAAHERSWLLVTDDASGEVIGAIDARSLVRSYRQAARSQQVRPMEALSESLHALEFTLSEGSWLAGAPLRELRLPPSVRIVAVTRDAIIMVPDGETVLLPGDRLTVSIPRGGRSRALAVLGGERPA